MRNIFFITALTWLIFNIKVNAQYCTSNARYTETQFFDLSEITIGSNITYGTAPDFLGNPYALRMDFYYPSLAIDTSAKRPFILLFHGGGFSSGDKQSGDIKDLCIHLAMRGYVCASANYRLGHDFSEYGQYKARYRAIQDGHAALRYVVQNANTIRIDTNWLFAGGQSAGSLLALGMAYADQSELDSISLLYGTTASSVELGNLYTTGNNLNNTYNIKGIFNNWGGVNENEVDIEELIPTIAFHGAQDTTVFIDADTSFFHYTLNGSGALHEYLIVNDICSEITIDPSGEHGIYRNDSSIFRAQRASCFFKNVFCNNCASFYATDSIPSSCSTTSGTDESFLGSNIRIYPNPFENSFSIDGFDGDLEVTIYNTFGQMVYKDEKHRGILQIDLKSGIYFISVRPHNFDIFYKSKLIKQ